MNSAEREAWNVAKAVILGHAKNVALMLVLSGAFLLTYCQGVRAGRVQERTKQHDAVRAAQLDTLKKLAKDTAALRKEVYAATEAVTAARAPYREAKKRVQVKDDTTLTVDGIDMTVPPIVTVRITSADTLVGALTRKDTTQTIQTVVISRIATTEHNRAENDEAQIKDTRPPRAGFKTGAAVGALLVGLLVYLIK